MNDRLEIKVALQVTKSCNEVFDAIVTADKMKNYFISEASSDMKEGEKIIWKFAEMDMEFLVQIDKIEKGKYISYYWDGAFDNEQTFVEITLTAVKPNLTFISITEKSKANNQAGIKWLKSNTEGWANFLACLKAWMEYGVHLRKDAFNTSQLPV